MVDPLCHYSSLPAHTDLRSSQIEEEDYILSICVYQCHGSMCVTAFPIILQARAAGTAVEGQSREEETEEDHPRV